MKKMLGHEEAIRIIPFTPFSMGSDERKVINGSINDESLQSISSHKR